ncbi:MULTISPECIES: hypothetical protein [Streptomyces violaceusniger group]|uniref:Uncharacterized protein n=1 Tax=Streptomyces rhizosphaericus TaxID=114699 RepID=A0ABN1REU1_9ACTN|nr:MULTISPECIES: hypothetical protein [Streptomyces violaceusniger group]
MGASTVVDMARRTPGPVGWVDDRDRARALLLPVGTQFTPGIHQLTLIAPAPAELT